MRLRRRGVIPGNLRPATVDVAGPDQLAAAQRLAIGFADTAALTGLTGRDDRIYLPSGYMDGNKRGPNPVQTFERATAPAEGRRARTELQTSTTSVSTAWPDVLQQLAALEATYGA